MSYTWRKYLRTDRDREYNGSGETGDLSLTAFVGGDTFGNGVQLTIAGSFIRLTAEQARDLSRELLKRADGERSATVAGEEYERTVGPDGEVVEDGVV